MRFNYQFIILKLLSRVPLLILLFGILFSCNKDEIIDKQTDTIIPKTGSDNQNEIQGLPEVITLEIYDLTINAVNIGGKLIDKGNSEIKEVGFVLGLSPQPTITSNYNKFSLELNANNEFGGRLTDLSHKLYYLRAFAVNEQGVSYGSDVQISTLPNKIFTGDVILSTQDEVNSFGSAGYNTIDGWLRINGPIEDLSPLKDLVAVGWGFRIVGTNLENLKGLDNLETIGSAWPFGIEISGNPLLKNLDGLGRLYTIRYDFVIQDNPSLENLYGLDSFTYANGNFVIQNCPQLTSLTGLETLEVISTQLFLKNNAQLSDLTALRKLNKVSDILIWDNPVLQNLEGLVNIQKADLIQLYNNASLSDLDALLNFTEIGQFEIHGCESLLELPQFESTLSFGNIDISYGNGLTDLRGFSNVSNIKGIQLIQSNIASLSGLEKVESLEFRLNLISNFNLQDLTGLNNLRSVGDGSANAGIYIQSNDNLISLKGLDHVEVIRGKFNLTQNPSLQNIDGLESLRSAEKIGLYANQTLENINGLSGIQELSEFTLEANLNLNNLPNFMLLERLDNLFIISGDAFTNLEGLNNVSTIGNLTIKESSIQSLIGLDNLQIVEELTIESNNNLIDLRGLEQLSSVSGYFQLWHNQNLLNLEGLNNLKSIVFGDFDIRGNESLTSLVGLESLNNIGSNLNIIGNPLCSDFCSITSLFTTGIVGGSFSAVNNLNNPSSQDIQDGNCN